MHLAIIDCGTNTFNLLIIKLSENKQYEKLFNTRVSVKLGEGSINESIIAPLPFARGLDALKLFSNEIKNHKVETVLAFATSAIRDAKNGEEFTQQAERDINIPITIIDGNREADLIYLGVKEAVKLKEHTSLIIDVGGGSTEFILANHAGVFWKQSFSIGAARLLEKFSPSNPITSKEINEINHYLKEILEPLFVAVTSFPVSELIGSSGAFDSVIEMINGELGGEEFLDSKTEYEINLHHYSKISELIIQSDLEQRKKIKGLVPMRFDMIVISCLMIDFILNSFQLKKMRVSTYSLKEGALMDFINKKT